jgi:hypothetical protein
MLVDRNDIPGAAVRWHQLTEECYPPGQLPRQFFRQRGRLVRALPEGMRAAEEFSYRVERASEFDPYHDGVADAMASRYHEGIAKLQPFTESHPQHFQSWFVLGICHVRKLVI